MAIAVEFDFYSLCGILRLKNEKNNEKILKLYQICPKMIPHKYIMLKK